MDAALERLRRLPIAPVRIRLETTEPFRSPEYKGALFRGGFGKFFRELVCETGLSECPGCPKRRGCLYSEVFETPADPERFGVLRKGTNLPHPFVLVPPLDNSTWQPPGSPMILQLTLVNNAERLIPVFAEALDSMGRAGTYGGGFRVVSVESALPPHHVLYDGSRMATSVPLWQAEEEAGPVEGARLEFLSPLRLRVDGRYTSQPGFTGIVQSLLRRIHLLTVIYAGREADSGWLRPLYEAADGVRTTQARFRPFLFERFSGRQERPIPMDGVVGSLAVRGDLTRLAPFLKAGQWLNVGSQTALGLGRYTAEFACRGSAVEARAGAL
jgi:hypothetical protein